MASVLDQSPNFSIKTSSFEGPLDLLLSFVKKRKLHISDISLAKITDDVIEHISTHTYNHEELLALLHVLSTLLLIKSQALLPHSTLTTEEVEEVQDLKESLLLYEKIKECSNWIAYTFNAHSIPRCSVQKPAFKHSAYLFDTTITAHDIALAAHSILARQNEKEERIPQHNLQKKVLLSEVLILLKNRLSLSLNNTFSEMNASIPHPPILLFLALLELAKEGDIELEQRAHDIVIQNNVLTTPSYGISS